MSANRVAVAVRVRALCHGEATPDVAVQVQGSTCEVHAVNRGRFPFTFDHCFDSNSGEVPATQAEVFQTLGMPLVDNAFDGLNSSVVAYGPTGSGKTYSVFGPAGSLGTAEEGLLPRVCNELFSRIKASAVAPVGPPTRHTVRVAALEVYVEEAYDLLAQRKPLKVRAEPGQRFGVPGMTWYEVSDYGDIVGLLKEAERNKTFAATAVHDRSSRAHTLFHVELRSSTVDVTRTARIVLADLAGSERIKEAKTESGAGFLQAKSINLSLLTLGTCIEAVVRQQRTQSSTSSQCISPRTPGRGGAAATSSTATSAAGIGEFRNSTLTKLLKDVLGGNSRTVVLVNIAPTLDQVSHTLQALRFADRAKQLTNHAQINARPVDPHLTRTVERGFEARRGLLEEECRLQVHLGHLLNRQTQLEGTLASLAHRSLSSCASIRQDADRQRRAIEQELQQVLETQAEVHQALEDVRDQSAQHYAEAPVTGRRGGGGGGATPRTPSSASADGGHDGEDPAAELERLRAFTRAMQLEKEDESALRDMEMAALRAEYEARLDAVQRSCDDVVHSSNKCAASGMEQVRVQAEERCRGLESAIATLEEDAADARRQLVNADEEILTLQRRVADADAAAKKHKDEAFAVAARAVDAEAELERVTEELAVTKRGVEDEVAKVAQAGEDIASLKAEREKLRATAEDFRAALVAANDNNAAADATVEDLKSALLEKADDLAAAERRIGELRREASEAVAAKLAASNEAASAADARVKSLEHALADADVRFAELEEALRRAATEHENLTENLQAAHASSTRQKEDLRAVRRELELREDQIRAATSAHRSEVARLEEAAQERANALEAALRIAKLDSGNALHSVALQCAAAQKALETATAVIASHQQQTGTPTDAHPMPISRRSAVARTISPGVETPKRRSLASAAAAMEAEERLGTGDLTPTPEAPRDPPTTAAPSPVPTQRRSAAHFADPQPVTSPAVRGSGAVHSPASSRRSQGVFGGSPFPDTPGRGSGVVKPGSRCSQRVPTTAVGKSPVDLAGSPDAAARRSSGAAPLSVMKENATSLFN